MSWFPRKVEPRPPTALDIIELELVRLHHLINQFTGEPHDYLIAAVNKLHDALVNRVTEERIAKLITEEADETRN